MELLKKFCFLLATLFAASLSRQARADGMVIDSRDLTYCSGISEIFDKHYGGASMDALSMWPSMDSTGGIFVRVPDEFLPSVESFTDGQCFCVDYNAVTTSSEPEGPASRFVEVNNTVIAPARACTGSEGKFRKATKPAHAKKPVPHKPVKHRHAPVADDCYGIEQILGECY